MMDYKFKPGDRVRSKLGIGVVVAKNRFVEDTEPIYAVQLDEWEPNAFTSNGTYITQEQFLSPQLCPTCHR